MNFAFVNPQVEYLKSSQDYRLAVINKSQVDLLSVENFTKEFIVARYPNIIGTVGEDVVDAAWGPPELTPLSGSLIAVLDVRGYVVVYQYQAIDYWLVYFNLNNELNWNPYLEGGIAFFEWSPALPNSATSLIALGSRFIDGSTNITLCLINKHGIKRVTRFICDPYIYKIWWTPKWLSHNTISLTGISSKNSIAFLVTMGNTVQVKTIER